MRISDWSSDVCSSDLKRRPAAFAADPAIFDNPLGLEIADGEVGVVTEREAPFAGDAAQALRAGTGQIDATRQREPPGVDVVEHHRQEERRVGAGGVITCRYRGSPSH